MRELENGDPIILLESSNGRVHEGLLAEYFGLAGTHLVEVELFEVLLTFTASAIPQTIIPTAIR